MTDDHLEDVSRETFAARAATVTRGPDWDDEGEHLAIGSRPRRTARWVAPLAAAAVVLAVVGATFALRDGRQLPTRPGVSHQLPIPKGMKAVDALGVEIFVPTDMPVDEDGCHGVVRPVGSPATVHGGRLCTSMLSSTLVFRTTPETAQLRSCPASESVTLVGERACVTRDPRARAGADGGFYSIFWPRHEVALTSWGLDAAEALAIIKSAHEVPVDRNGCVARNTALAAPQERAPGLFDAELLPASTESLSVCWYIGNRLAASSLLDEQKAQRVVRAANGMAPKWPPPTVRPGLPSCAQSARTDGVVLIAHRNGEPDVTAVTRFAACDGQRVSTSPTAAFLTSDLMAATIAGTTGIPLTLDYRPGS